MKHVVILLFCFFSKTIQAQHRYIPIPEDSVLWIVVDENWHESDPSNPPHTFTYEVRWFEGKDTIVNNTRYTCLYGGSNIDMPPTYGNSASGSIWVRQDTTSKKIWRVYAMVPPNYIPMEHLVYDFSLQVGDTFNDPTHQYFGAFLNPHKAWIDAIDSVYWADGTWRYRWFIKSDLGGSWGNPAHTVQIEGMGYINNPFLADPFTKWRGVFNNTYEVCCFGVKGQWLYTQPNPWGFDCDSMIARDMLGPLTVPDIAGSELERPMLYPNPATDYVIINSYAGAVAKDYAIEAYDIYGRNVLQTYAQPGSTLYLREWNLPKGIYCFQIKDKERLRLLHQQKIIIQ